MAAGRDLPVNTTAATRKKTALSILFFTGAAAVTICGSGNVQPPPRQCALLLMLRLQQSVKSHNRAATTGDPYLPACHALLVRLPVGMKDGKKQVGTFTTSNTENPKPLHGVPAKRKCYYVCFYNHRHGLFGSNSLVLV